MKAVAEQAVEEFRDQLLTFAVFSENFGDHGLISPELKRYWLAKEIVTLEGDNFRYNLPKQVQDDQQSHLDELVHTQAKCLSETRAEDDLLPPTPTSTGYAKKRGTVALASGGSGATAGGQPAAIQGGGAPRKRVTFERGTGGEHAPRPGPWPKPRTERSSGGRHGQKKKKKRTAQRGPFCRECGHNRTHDTQRCNKLTVCEACGIKHTADFRRCKKLPQPKPAAEVKTADK